MTKKQLLAIVLCILFGGILITFGVIGVYKKDPTLLGLPPEAIPLDSASLVMVDSTAIKAEQELQRQEEARQRERDSLIALTKRLSDSLSRQAGQLDSVSVASGQFEASLQAERRQNTRDRDSLAVANLETFAQIYNNANPQEVAQILANLDIRDAATILKMMKKKNAAKVLEAMAPEQAASIVTLSTLDI